MKHALRVETSADRIGRCRVPSRGHWKWRGHVNKGTPWRMQDINAQRMLLKHRTPASDSPLRLFFRLQAQQT